MPSRLFPLIRPVYENEPELELASTEARNNAELNVALERQIAFDNEIVDQLRMLALSDAQIEKLESSLAEDYGQLAQPPIITAPATAHVPGATASCCSLVRS